MCPSNLLIVFGCVGIDPFLVGIVFPSCRRVRRQPTANLRIADDAGRQRRGQIQAAIGPLERLVREGPPWPLPAFKLIVAAPEGTAFKFVKEFEPSTEPLGYWPSDLMRRLR